MATVERAAYLAGYLYHDLLFFADFFWFQARLDEPLPSRWAIDAGEMSVALNQLTSDTSGGDLATAALTAFDQARQDFAQAWQDDDHRELVECRDRSDPDVLSSEQWTRDSPIRRPSWQAFCRAINTLLESLPETLRVCFTTGRLVAQVLQSPLANERFIDIFVEEHPLAALGRSFYDLRRTFNPLLDHFDVELSDAISRGSGVAHLDAVYQKVLSLHRWLVLTLATARKPADTEVSHSCQLQVRAEGQQGQSSMSANRESGTALAPLGMVSPNGAPIELPPPGRPQSETATVSDDAMLSGPDLARIFEVDYDSLRGRLGRFRRDNLDGSWREVSNRRPREPRYLYRMGEVRSIIENMTSGEGPSNVRRTD